MKKYVSIVLILSMMLSLISIIPVLAAVTPIDSEDFDPGYSTNQYYAGQVTDFDGMATMTAMVDENDATIGNYIRAAWGSDTAKYPTYNYNVKKSFKLAADDKMELEFDVRLTGYDSTAFQIRLKGTTQTYVVNFETSGKIYRQATNTSDYKKQIGTMPTGWEHTNFKNWTRLKFVFAHTKYIEKKGETKEYEGKKLTALYVNGQPITLAENASSNVAYDNGTIWGAMDGNNAFTQTNEVGYKGFYFGNKMAQTNMIDVDNINVITCKISDTAPTEKGALVKKIRDIQNEYGDGSVYPHAKVLIDEAKAMYVNETASAEDVISAIAKLDEAESLLTSIVNTREMWNFEDGPYDSDVFTKGTTKEEAFGMETDATDSTINKYLKGTATGQWSNFYWKPRTYTTFDNEVLELEFDFKAPTFPGDKEFQFRLVGKSEQFRIGIYSGGGVYRATTDSSNKVSIPTKDGYPRKLLGDWHRIKFVFENKTITKDGTTYTGRKLVGLYVNNENLLNTSHSNFASEDPNENGCLWFGMTDANVLESDEKDFVHVWFVGRNTTSEEFGWDNLSVTQYTKDVAVTDLSELVTEIRAAQADYQSNSAEFGEDSSKAEALAAYNKSITDAWSVYQNTTSTQTDFDNAIQAMKGYKDLFGQAKIVSINYGGASVLTANGSITGVVLKKTYRTDDAGVVLVGLYDETTKELKGVTLAKNVFTDEAVGDVTITFEKPISVPTSISGLYVKAFLWDALSGMNALDMVQQ